VVIDDSDQDVEEDRRRSGNGVRNAEVSVGGTDFSGLTVNCQSSIYYTAYTTSIQTR